MVFWPRKYHGIMVPCSKLWYFYYSTMWYYHKYYSTFTTVPWYHVVNCGTFTTVLWYFGRENTMVSWYHVVNCGTFTTVPCGITTSTMVFWRRKYHATMVPCGILWYSYHSIIRYYRKYYGILAPKIPCYHAVNCGTFTTPLWYFSTT